MIKKYFIGIQDKGRGHFTDLLSDAFASVRANSSAYVYEYQEATTKKQIADTYSPDTRGIILFTPQMLPYYGVHDERFPKLKDNTILLIYKQIG